MERRVFLGEAADAARAVGLDPAVAPGVGHLGAEQRAARAGAVVVADERAQVGVDEAVAVEDQHRIGVKPRAREPDRAGRAQRPWLDDRIDPKVGGGMLAQMRDHGLRLVAEPKHDPARTEAPQPVEQIVEIGALADRREQFWNITEDRAYPRAKAASENEDVKRRKAALNRRRSAGHATDCAAPTLAFATPISSTIRRRSLCLVMRSICVRVSQPNFCVTISR